MLRLLETNVRQMNRFLGRLSQIIFFWRYGICGIFSPDETIDLARALEA